MKYTVATILFIIAFLIWLCPLYFMFVSHWSAIFGFVVSWFPALIIGRLSEYILEQ